VKGAQAVAGDSREAQIEPLHPDAPFEARHAGVVKLCFVENQDSEFMERSPAIEDASR